MEIEQILKQGEGYFTDGNLEAAKECFRKILETDPNHIEALNNLGAIAFHEGTVDNAISYFRKVLEIDKDYLEATENLARCLEAKGDFVEAVKLYRRALELGMVNTDILNSMGNCFTQLEELTVAYEVYKQSLQIDENQVHIKSFLQGLETFIRCQEKEGTHGEIPLFTTPQKLKQLSAKDKYRIQIISFSDFETNEERRLRWGDYWVKYEIQKEFEKAGHTICDSDPDIIVHLFGVPVTNLPEAPYKIIWIHSHPDMVTPEILSKYDKIYCLSPTFTKKIRSWGFNAELLVGGTAKTFLNRELCYDIVFVGNAKGPSGRKIIRDLGKTSYKFKVWGEGWKNILPPENYGGLYYENERLPELYASSRIVLNDHHEDMRREGFLNPRILDVFAGGGFVISDDIKGLEDLFGETLITYRNPEELKRLIDFYIKHPEERKRVIKKGQAIALQFTFSRMVKQFLSPFHSISSSPELPLSPKLHIGCGRQRLKGFINIDIIKTPAADVIADARDLPFKSCCISRIESYHMIEHLPRHHFPLCLQEWNRTLTEDGTLVIECPDFDQTVKEYISGKSYRINNIFGLQRHKADIHLFGYNFERLSSVLQRGGFGDIIRESPIDYHKLEEPCLRITARKQTTLSEILSEESLLNETIVHYQQQIKKFMAALSQVKSVKESSTKSSAEAVGNIAEATSNIEMAKQMPPHNCSAFNDEGKLYYARGEWHKAESSFQKALAISARNVEAAYGLSMVYLKQKRKEESIIALKKCMAIEPSFENAASLLKQQLLDSTLLEGRELPAHRKYTFMHVAWEDKKTSFPEMTPAVILAFDTITKHIPGISLLACSRRKLCDYPWEVIDIIRENKRINFREMVEESVSLNSGTVFLYPANSDAYRLNLIRVLQSGIPVIAAVSFARGIVEHGYNGLLVQVEDVRRNGHCQYLVRVNDLAMKMAFLAKDPELISEMTAHALQRRNALK